MKEFVLASNILLSNVKRLNLPYKLTFPVTDLCNSRCTTCNIWKKKPKNELTLREIQHFFKQNNQFVWIDISGGEPFLRPDIVEVSKAIIKNCKNLYMFHLPTNGLLPNLIVKRIAQIARLKPKKFVISVSLDGPPKLYKQIRGVEGFDKALETYQRIKRIPGVETFLGMTLSTQNYNQIDETFAAVKKRIPNFKYKDLHINIYHTSEHYYGNSEDNFPKAEVLRELKRFAKRKGSAYLNPIMFLEHKYLQNVKTYFATDKTPMPCQALNASVFLDAKGDVYPCSMYNLRLGNIREKSLKQIWKESKKIRNDIHKGKCTQCWTPCEAYQTMFGNLIKLL
ncbi:MAG: radical SAM protein [archaeon]